MKLVYRPTLNAKPNKCYVIEVAEEDWKQAFRPPISSSIKGEVIFVGYKFDNKILKLTLGDISYGFCNPFYDLTRYYNSNFNGLLPISKETFQKEFVESNAGAVSPEHKNS